MNRIAAQRKLGQNIAAMRKSRAITQLAFARMCGLPTARIWQIEYGRVNITLATLVRMASQLQIKPAELLRGIQ